MVDANVVRLRGIVHREIRPERAGQVKGIEPSQRGSHALQLELRRRFFAIQSKSKYLSSHALPSTVFGKKRASPYAAKWLILLVGAPGLEPGTR
jgi:hypothetical protein